VYGSGPQPTAPANGANGAYAPSGPWAPGGAYQPGPFEQGPWGPYGSEIGASVPAAEDPGEPGTVFWPTTTAWMRFDPARPARWGIPDIFLGILAFLVSAFLVTGAIVGIGAAATGLAPGAFAQQYAGILGIAGLLGSWVAVISFLLLIVHLKGSGSLRRDLGFSFSWWDPLIGFGGAIVVITLNGLIQVVINALTGAPPASNSEAIFGGVMDDKVLLVAMSLMASIGAPIVEELLFRGLALRAIEKRFGAVAGILGSSVLFGALHFDPSTVSVAALIAGISMYGLVFSLLTRWWQRLGPSIFAHIWVNTIATSVLLISVLFG
jgi:membrane protease YdiL (CAAX protease family)